MPLSIPRRTVIGLLAATIAGTALPRIGMAGEGDREPDHDRARRALERGEILSLAKVMAVVHDRVNGDIVGVELEHDGHTWIYEFRVLKADGRIVEVTADAATARILKGGGD